MLHTVNQNYVITFGPVGVKCHDPKFLKLVNCVN